MTAKQLMKSLEAANMNSKQTGMSFYVAVDFIDTESHVSFSVENINDNSGNSGRFHNWDDFAASLAAEYTEDVSTLVGTQQLAKHGEGIYTLANPEICRGVALRFFIYHE